MASKGDGSHDLELRSDTDGDQLLKQVCQQLSLRTTKEMVATSLKPDTQKFVSTQLLPLTFEPHGLTTPISVIVNLLVHCFVLNRELEEVKGHTAEVVEDVRALKELYEGVSCNLIGRSPLIISPHAHLYTHTHTHTHRSCMLINSGLWIMTSY